MLEDTISAVCTAPAEGSIGIIRISGPESLTIIEKIFKAKNKDVSFLNNINRLIYGHVYDRDMNIIDEVLCVYMKAPHSYTAEDVVEIQCHGGLIILKKILQLIFSHGARPAEPGEFTQRAFLHGRIDLAQAEAVMSMIKARSEIALKQVIYQQQGTLSKQIKLLRDKLKDAIVETEAVIDYPEEDLEDVTVEKVAPFLQDVYNEISQLIKGAQTGRIIKEGLRTVIVGKPNVGKSSLLNALAGEDIAIVTEIAGTTRDSIEEQLFFDGVPLVLIDTAGIRDTQDKVEQIGIEKSKEKLSKADMVLLLLDGSETLSYEDEHLIELIKDKPHIVLINKNDLPQTFDIKYLHDRFSFDKKDIINIASKDKSGWQEFNQRLKEKVYGESASLGEGIYVQEARHKALLQDAQANLCEALLAAQAGLPLDCILIDARNAFNNLGLITGETVTDEILQEIFSRFCLGK